MVLFHGKTARKEASWPPSPIQRPWIIGHVTNGQDDPVLDIMLYPNFDIIHVVDLNHL